MNVNFGYLEQKLSRELHPENQKKAKPKTIDSQTRPEDILDMFQNQNLAPAEWENLAEQILKREVQKVADDLRGNVQPAASERDTIFEPRQALLMTLAPKNQE